MDKMFSIILLLLLVVVGCDSSEDEDIEVIFELEPRLSQDANGYYHLELNPYKWQTFHRISGYIYKDGEPAEFVKFHWASSHFWIIDDSVGYIIDVWNCYDGGCEEPWESPTYVGVDTIYVSYFSGMEVPTINCCSYSNADGEVNTVFAPVWNMRNDTVTVSVGYWDHINDRESEVQSIEIVLD